MAMAAQIESSYKLKDGSLKEPTQYLGANVGQFLLNNCQVCGYTSSEECAKAELETVEKWLKGKGHRGLLTRAACVLPSKYKPELNVTDELTPDDVSYYQQQNDILRWMVELGRIDICTEVSMLAAFTANPR